MVKTLGALAEPDCGQRPSGGCSRAELCGREYGNQPLQQGRGCCSEGSQELEDENHLSVIGLHKGFW
jgi:hypothetical protein